ncbi:MAG: hypothetical protein KAI73_01365, partial [Rhodospirillaceae bacterium]|nr:hypothetical protein [Rhodospirillaceae bacterium]
MAEETKTLEDLKDLMAAPAAAAEGSADVVAPETVIAAPVEPVIDAQGRAYATGKRKNAIAR